MRLLPPFLSAVALLTWLGLATQTAAFPRPAAPPAPRKIKVLIVDGFSNHDWRLTTALIRGVLEPTGLCDVAVSTAPERAADPGWAGWRPGFGDYDVVIQNCNDINGGPSWPRPVQQDLEAFVHGGGGLYAFHSANNAFAGWTAYEQMVGLLWRGPGGGWAIRVSPDGTLERIPPGVGSGTSHHDRSTRLVTCLGEHPIHAGMPRSWLTPDLEVYTYARGPAQNMEVLSYAADPVYGERWPIEWTVAYGTGRVYSSTMGHVWKGDVQPASMRCVAEQTLLIRAVQWLAHRPVTWPVPADFPTADAISLRPDIPLPAPAGPAP